MCQVAAPVKMTKEEKRELAIAKATAKTIKLLPLDDYDTIIVSFSGGKDSLACVLDLLDRGVPAHKIELWHQHVDGNPSSVEEMFMDWPVTEAYCRAVAAHLGIPIYFQWRDGGFYRELTKVNARTAGVSFEDANGNVVHLETGDRAKEATRGKYPQKGSDLSTRWCSPALKIDVFARALANSPRFNGQNILVVTGERGQESDNRALYAESENHRCHAQKRLVHAWRPIHKWTEQQVWAIIERFGVMPHPAYYLGYGRVSCMFCIFLDPNGWATGRELHPKGFAWGAETAPSSGATITKGLTIVDQADKGTSTLNMDDAFVRRQAELSMGLTYPTELVSVPDGQWQVPSGAYKRCGGPT
jgi:3'-phosphoadenosine 5'-phosphosulfate sulfotransferase (PAPS reductase)/FAD synthetase